MFRWEVVLKEIEHRHPFLDNVRISVNGFEDIVPLPSFLRVCIAVASGLYIPNRGDRVVMVVPRLYETALWTAFGAALCAMRSDFDAEIEALPRFLQGQKLQIDCKWIVEFDSETDSHYRLKASANSYFYLPRESRFRLQPTITRRPLTRINFVHTSPPEVAMDALDHILGIQAFGNRSIYRHPVLLVSRVGRVNHLLKKAELRIEFGKEGRLIRESLCNLFQCGTLSLEGRLTIISTGQVDAPPVLITAPDLIAVREYLRDNPDVSPLILLDGDHSFNRRIEILDRVLEEEDLPVLSLVERMEADSLQPLAVREFKGWVWSVGDFEEMVAPESRDDSISSSGPFAPLCKALDNFSRHCMNLQVCADRELEYAATLLQEFLQPLEKNDDETIELERAFYGFLNRLARMVRPVGCDLEAFNGMKAELCRIEDRLQLEKHWLSAESYGQARKLIDILHTLLEREPDQDGGKVGALGRLLAASPNTRQTVVVGNLEEVTITRRYWQTRGFDSSRLVISCSSTLEGAVDSVNPVICGWLGGKRMRQILEGYLSQQTTILLYRFEETWLTQTRRRWGQNRLDLMSTADKAGILRLPSFDLLSRPETPLSVAPEYFPTSELEISSKVSADDLFKNRHKPPSHDKQKFDIEEFELRLNIYGSERHLPPHAPGEQVVSAFRVTLSGGHYCYLTEHYEVPVVTDFVSYASGELEAIPMRSVSHLNTGDFVVFSEGTQVDVLRELADEALRRSGRGHLRELSGLWKRALRQFADTRIDSWLDAAEVRQAIRRLVAAGIERTEVTLRGWLTDDSTIGPRNEGDLDIIARTTGDPLLNAKLLEVKNAIKEVRGAHLQASGYLAKRLLASLPELLQGTRVESVLNLDIDGLVHAVVTCVEEIAADPVCIGITHVNRLKIGESSDLFHYTEDE